MENKILKEDEAKIKYPATKNHQLGLVDPDICVYQFIYDKNMKGTHNFPTICYAWASRLC